MGLDSYKLSRQYSCSNPRKEMLREKKYQVQSLYELAMDREDDVFLNGELFSKSPRIFDRKFVDTVHHKITVETILDNDWMECGDYLEYDGMIWLCLNSYSFHGLYCRATFMSCDWKIYWMDEKNELHSEYVIDQNSTQYNSGEYGDYTMTIGSSQHMLKMQCNDNTVMLDSPMRFAIDKNMKKPTCYKVTQNDNSSYNYGKGLCCITVSETQFNPNTDKKIKLSDGSEVWICDYKSNTDNGTNQTQVTSTFDAEISGIKKIKIGYPRTYTVIFKDFDNKEFDWTKVSFLWKVESDFPLDYQVNGNKIQFNIDDESLIGGSFLLKIMDANNQTISQETIQIIKGV